MTLPNELSPTVHGFRVEFDTDDEGLPMSPQRLGAGAKFKVSLPHQCDRWRIDNYDWYLDGSFKDEAIEELESFIKEAQAALEALKKGEEFQNS